MNKFIGNLLKQIFLKIFVEINILLKLKTFMLENEYFHKNYIINNQEKLERNLAINSLIDGLKNECLSDHEYI